MAKKRNYKVAKDFTIGTRFMMETWFQSGIGGMNQELVPVTLVAYSKQGDEVVIVETDEGTVYTKNINDLKPADYVDPIDGFIEHITDAMQNAFDEEYTLTVDRRNNALVVLNESDNIRYKITVERI